MRNNFYVTKSMMKWPAFTIEYMIALKKGEVFGCKVNQLVLYSK